VKETPCRSSFPLLSFCAVISPRTLAVELFEYQYVMERTMRASLDSATLILGLFLLGWATPSAASKAAAEHVAAQTVINPSKSSSQELPSQEVSPSELEDVLGEEAGSTEAAFVVDRLERFKGKPLDLNSATVAELCALPWISPVLARKIVSLREKVGRFRSLIDLSIIEGVDYELLNKITPYVSVAAKGVPFWIPLEGRVRLVGETSARKLKDVHLYTRAISRPSQRIELSYVTDKDEGESSFGDFQAGYVTVQSEALLSSVSVGDLSAEFGQGLVLWAPTGFFRGYETVSQTNRSGSGVHGYRSSLENGALRGAHAKLKGKWLSFEALFSRSKLDAYLNDDGTARGLAETGYHREDWELRGKDALTEEMFAFHARAEYAKNRSLEGTFYTAGYKPPFSSNETSSSYSFTGKRASVGGISGSFSLAQTDIFGEAALMSGGPKAVVFGWVSDVHGIEVASVFRSYDRDFYNMRASSFSGGNSWNERGVYVGLQGRFGKYKLSGYLDGIQHPRPTGVASCPTSGYETAGSIEQDFGTGITLRVRGKLSRNDDSITDPSDPYGKVSSVSSRETIHTDVSWTPGKSVSMKLRFSTVRADENEKGSLVFAGFSYAPEGLLTLRGRVIYFDTSSYESRVYEYEDDLPGRVTLTPLWDEGVRWYLVLGVRGRRLRAEAKFSQTHLTETRTADDDGNSEVGLQLDFAF
jgi:DNA uptake protein ComE-like DNA-binding protein